MSSHRKPPHSTPSHWAEARRLVNLHGWDATAYQILNPGIERWFGPEHEAVIGYVTSSGYRVVAGSPVCAPERLEGAVEAFEDETHRLGLVSCYFATDDRLARLLEHRGPLDRILLGAQPVWRPARWPAILRRKASLRAQLNRARNKGVEARRWPAARATGHPELARCLAEWLATRGLPPLQILIEPETLGRLHDRKVFVAEQRGRVVGFLMASPVPRRNGWLVEQDIRGADAPNGTTELLISAALDEMREEGAEYVTLGLSPLSRRAGIGAVRQAAWLRFLLAWLRAHGKRFYNFEGLDDYKAKFLPESWEPIYAITSERRIGPGTLYAIAGAFGKMSPVALVARALGRAAAREAAWLRARARRAFRLGETATGSREEAARDLRPAPRRSR